MKKWITALTFALALLVLSACSAQPGKTAAETEAEKADTEKLLVVSPTGAGASSSM